MFETFLVVLLLLTFLVPGFIWRSVESQFVYLDKRLEWEKLALGLLTRSSLIYLLLSSLIYEAWKNSWYENHPLLVSLGAIVLIFFLPAGMGVLWPVIYKKIPKDGPILKWLQKLTNLSFLDSNIPSAWDSIFAQRRADWVIVTLKSGRQIHGYMSANSYASSDYHERDIYISHAMKPQPNSNNIFELVSNTHGVYIRAEEISSIEFIGEANEQTKQQRSVFNVETHE
ncbi:MAG: hypothetical protein C5B47_01215 [Verrucomicrobia bacterium]|nr:MAG: hypothetical protein C5B47_01215 [Verrucomicrobiota bacterium]